MSLKAGRKSISAPKIAAETLKIVCLSEHWLESEHTGRQRNLVGSAGSWQRNSTAGPNLAPQARHNHLIIEIIASPWVYGTKPPPPQGPVPIFRFRRPARPRHCKPALPRCR